MEPRRKYKKYKPQWRIIIVDMPIHYKLNLVLRRMKKALVYIQYEIR